MLCIGHYDCSSRTHFQNLSIQVKKTKNVSHDVFGTKLGRVHMQRQDFSKLQTRKIKGLKRSKDMTSRHGPKAKKQKTTS